MGKNKYFSTKSVFGQLISLIDDSMIKKAVKKHDSNRYVKHFKCQDHLFSMIFCTLEKCNSLREVSGGMVGLSDKKETVRINHLPKKSTLADANKGRKVEFFEEIYNNLLKKYSFVFSDSRIEIALGKKVKIVDSTTISLFKDILKCVGRKASDGKSKGGIKSHSVINADEKVPNLVWFTPATTHDHQFLEKLKCDEHTVYVFDKGYNDYKAFGHFSEQNTGFVTRIKDNAKHQIIQQNEIPENIHSGVLSDEIIEVEVNKGSVKTKLKLRKIKYYDREHKRSFDFISNLFEFRADTIAALYKIRWQIELLFKQIKQNFPLKYFLGDNENAIKIQIYCVLIVNLLLGVVKKSLKRQWSFSNLVSFCRIHLFNYIHLTKFFENPENNWKLDRERDGQLGLFDDYLATG
ncbi:IS4 family transposase [Flavobacterium sp.]|uniref:IS4 family transposase n=1 Tax=Flavobacterium sp. TaxID=239 RepID=UPI00286AB7DE|nr:IS4 family transposase [Flavobacterium sp.]